MEIQPIDFSPLIREHQNGGNVTTKVTYADQGLRRTDVCGLPGGITSHRASIALSSAWGPA